jgi:ADP-ribosylglycohydrolase
MPDKNLLYDKVYGCLIGGLVGDAMGAPVEGWDYNKIKEAHGEVNDFSGEGTDDSAIKMILCEAIIKNGGYVTADEFAESFMRNKKYYNLFYTPVRNMFHKIEDKLELPVYAGLGNQQSSSSAMAISPMGIINACNPRQAALETYDVAGLIHAGSTTFCRDAACAMAAAVAEAINPESTVESVLAASTDYLHKISSRVIVEYIDKIINLAKSLNDYEAFRREIYENHLQSIICDSRETVPCTLALFYLAGGNPEKAIIYGVNFGRDADTVGSMVGALSGAFAGVGGLKREWVDKIRQNSPAQENLADDLIAVIKKRATGMNNIISAYKKLEQT